VGLSSPGRLALCVIRLRGRLGRRERRYWWQKSFEQANFERLLGRPRVDSLACRVTPLASGREDDDVCREVSSDFGELLELPGFAAAGPAQVVGALRLADHDLAIHERTNVKLVSGRSVGPQKLELRAVLKRRRPLAARACTQGAEGAHGNFEVFVERLPDDLGHRVVERRFFRAAELLTLN
jgi:hypothetical protein